jgi:23S rRNA pseudouridine1911/1915/1917 synthase
MTDIFPDTMILDDAEPDDAVLADAVPNGAVHAVVVADTQAGSRLDKLLADGIPALTRSRVQALLADGAVTGDGGTITDGALRVKPGQRFAVVIPAAVPAIPAAQDIPLAVVYEDDDLLVIDKPAGLVVHPAAGNADGTLVNALLAHCPDSLSGIGGVARPGIVHRLDKETSGLMVVAKNDRAHGGLTAQFADRSLSRTYHALVWGVPSPRQGRVDAAIGRSTSDRKKMAVVNHGGKPSATRYRVVRSYGQALALVECVLETGRTHQIRVHMAHIGHPVVGDPLYGGGRPARKNGTFAARLADDLRLCLAEFPRQALHAVGLTFRHPTTQVMMTFASDLPDDIGTLLSKLEPL